MYKIIFFAIPLWYVWLVLCSLCRGRRFPESSGGYEIVANRLIRSWFKEAANCPLWLIVCFCSPDLPTLGFPVFDVDHHLWVFVPVPGLVSFMKTVFHANGVLFVWPVSTSNNFFLFVFGAHASFQGMGPKQHKP